MANKISRRQLLSRGALLAGGLSFTGSFWESVQASPAGMSHLPFVASGGDILTDRDVAMGAPVELKARLFANENPFGPSDKAKKAIEEALPHSYQYPFMFLKDLTQKIADHEGVKQENILLAAGSSPLLLTAAICYSKPGGNIISGDPSYEDLPSRAVRFNEQWIKVPLTADYKLDLDAIEKKYQ